MKPVISIIVPIYNVETYLRKCISSILAQTYTHFELILINDESPDTCGEICDEYAQKDQRIKVIHKKNGGVSAARNSGLDVAKGEYIAFVDPDDWIQPHMYETLINTATNHQSDLVVCQYRLEDEAEGTTKVPQVWKQVDQIIDKQTIIHEVIPNVLVNNTFSLVPCYNKLYKKSILDQHKIRFDETFNFGEDKLFNFSLLPLLQSLIFIEEPLYVYVKHERDSLSRMFRDDFYTYLMAEKNFLIDLCQTCELHQKMATISNSFITNVLHYMQDVVNHKDLQHVQKKEILSHIIENQQFNENMKTYQADSVYYQLLKYLCLLKSKSGLTKMIKFRHKLKPTYQVTS